MKLQAQQLQVKRNHKLVLSLDELSIAAGEVVAVLGPNGAGKSSLVQALSGELKLFSGNITLNNIALAEWGDVARAQMLAVLPQNNPINFPLSVLEVVLLGRIPHATTHAENMAIARQCLQQVDMLYDTERYYFQLSGGEQQRVQLARILAQLVNVDDAVARYLLLDEPVSALDLEHQHMLLRLLRELAQQNKGIMVILHDLNLAMLYADRVVLLHEGREVANGVPMVVLNAETIQEVFNLPVMLISHPSHSGKKIVIPL